MREYYGIYLNNKVGVKDDQGTKVLEPIYDWSYLSWFDQGSNCL